jgi:hypothetical protein
LAGLAGAAVVIAAVNLVARSIERGPNRRRNAVVLFVAMFVLTTAGAVWIASQPIARLGLIGLVGLGLASLASLWAAVGTACEWPGFRDPPPND